jgi:hypothetical protein
MFGTHIIDEIREANDKLHGELGSINENLDEINKKLKILIDIEFEKLPKKAQRQIQEKWAPDTDS